jgi:hypothetical protein
VSPPLLLFEFEKLSAKVWADGVPGKENVAADLESFSRHAGRSTITTDDVLLITRRNDALYGIIREFIDKEKAGRERGVKGAAKGKGRVGVRK